MFFQQTTFDGKDKTKMRTHLQSFEDFVDRQKLDPEKYFKEIQEYFLMTLHDLARQWFTSTKFVSYDELKKKFTQEYSEYGKTPREWLKSWTKLRFHPDTDKDKDKKLRKLRNKQFFNGRYPGQPLIMVKLKLIMITHQHDSGE